jgi:flavodoxin
MMKKTIAILLSLVMILGLAACGNSASQTEQPSTEDTSVESKADTNAAENSTDKENTDNQDVQDHKVLVAYFSATGTTKGVAEHIANGLNADIYEIVPEDPYTEADLNYNDNNSRTTIEMNDPNARPAISGSVENMEQYDIIFVGYPIWWGEAPRIVSTFMESYDFSGKTIVPFCTSGGSGIGSSASNLERLTSGATWLDGRRLNGSDSQDTVMEWVNSLDLNLAE